MSGEALLWLVSVASGGACCVGTTSGAPTLVGECERATAGLGLGVQQSIGRWSRTGALASSSLRQTSGQASLGAGLRLHRRWQVGLQLPVRATHSATPGTSGWGGGPGDVTALVVWDPIEEAARPVPLFLLGARIPTGVEADEARGELLQDVTGQPGPGIQLGVRLDRTLGSTPYAVTVIGEGAETPELNVSASVGRYLGSRWTLLGSLAHQERWPEGGRAASTSATLRAVAGRPARWRAWGEAGSSLPVPGLGRSAPMSLIASGGAVLVFQ